MTIEAWIALLTFAFVLLTQVAGGVWVAAKMSTSINHLDRVTEKLVGVVSSLEKAVGKLDTRVTVLEDRQGIDNH